MIEEHRDYLLQAFEAEENKWKVRIARKDGCEFYAAGLKEPLRYLDVNEFFDARTGLEQVKTIVDIGGIRAEPF